MMENQINENQIKKISKHEFYFELPLYQSVSWDDLEKDIFSGDVDAYNHISCFDTTYEIDSGLEPRYISGHKGFWRVVLTCKRKNSDELFFFLHQDDEGIIKKVGQFPSLADIQFAELGKKYNKVLQKEELIEFKRAIGLASHGVGIGSFVYLRRIFEKLIYKSFNEHAEKLSISQEEFLQKRMEEKIDVLKLYLPSQLVEMKKIYLILSKGIHELSEEVCLQYFSVLKLSIELILDQKIEMELKEKKNLEVQEQILKINTEINN